MTEAHGNSSVAGDGDGRASIPTHLTAHKLGKRYRRGFLVSTNPDKRPSRPDDGYVTSAQYLQASRQVAILAGDADVDVQVTTCRYQAGQLCECAWQIMSFQGNRAQIEH